MDPAAMYESVKNRITALEEEEVLEEEEEKKFGVFDLVTTSAKLMSCSGGSPEIRKRPGGKCDS